jgi:DNA-binding transcriptional MerR regulator
MRIGELAALVGVSSRAVRHYHQQGLLPEPPRRGNGYRDYGMRHAVLLARIRRLTELGLSLAEVRDVLADDAGRDLEEVLEELDADLAAEQAALAERRARLAELIRQARQGGLPPEGPVSPQLAELFGALGPGDSPTAAKDRAHLAMIDSLVDPADRERIHAEVRPLLADPGFARRAAAVYRRLDELADADADDPRIAPLAEAIAAGIPEPLTALLGERLPADEAVGQAFLEDFSPAQAEVVRRLLAALAAGRREGS